MWAEPAEHGQPSATYVGTTSTGRASHAIRGEWNYASTNTSMCGKRLTDVQHLESGKPLAITCKACVHSIEYRATQG